MVHTMHAMRKDCPAARVNKRSGLPHRSHPDRRATGRAADGVPCAGRHQARRSSRNRRAMGAAGGSTTKTIARARSLVGLLRPSRRTGDQWAPSPWPSNRSPVIPCGETTNSDRVRTPTAGPHAQIPRDERRRTSLRSQSHRPNQNLVPVNR